MRNPPLHVWIISIICLFSPVAIPGFEEATEIVWFLHFVPIYLFAYYSGLTGGMLITLVSCLIHLGWEFGTEQHLHQDITDNDIEMIFGSTFFKLMSCLVVGYITKLLRRNQEKLESVNEQLVEQSKRLESMAYHDALTGLPNRYMLNEYLENAIYQAKRTDSPMAILFMDLDRFKMVNDSMGHDVGDELLKQVAQRIQQAIREEDIVSRQGGDEFIVLLQDTDEAESEMIANRIVQQFTQPFVLHNQSFFTSPSIGMSVYPKDGLDARTLIKNADQAMYKAKENGGNNHHAFRVETSCPISRQIRLEQGLHNALSNNELEVYYQPKIDLRTKRVVGVEALIRWNHPQLGMVSPMEFIPIAEESGLIIPIGKWIIKESCMQVKRWQTSGLSPSLHLSVNVSLRQFRDHELTESVAAIIKETGFDPKFLVIEITESMMHNFEESQLITKRLKEIGVSLALDDFGTGYSSLSVLGKIPLDYVKIDRSFVKNIHIDATASAITKTIIELGQNLNFKLIAEGVEEESQAEFLLRNDCYLAQGFLYSQPIPASKLEEYIRQSNRRKLRDTLATA